MTAPKKRNSRPLAQLLTDHSSVVQLDDKPATEPTAPKGFTPAIPGLSRGSAPRTQQGGPSIGSARGVSGAAPTDSGRIPITPPANLGSKPALPAFSTAPTDSGRIPITAPSLPGGPPTASAPTGRARSNAMSGPSPQPVPAPSAAPAPARPATPTPALSGLSTSTKQTASFKKMESVMRDYQAEADPGQKLLKADVLLGLCESYLNAYGSGVQLLDNRQAWVEDAYAEALRARGQALAQAQYLADAYGKSAPRARTPVVPNPAMKAGHQPKQKPGLLDTNLKKQDPRDKQSVIAGAQALGSGAKGGAGATDEALALMKKYGLTEAEILAVRTYTAADYKYINPAAANSAGWMAGSKAKRDADGAVTEAVSPEDMAQFFEEGSLHSGVAMMALQKLPPVVATVYRGARMTPKEFADADYFKGAAYHAFTSTSTDEGAALNFANGLECSDPNKTISVMLVLHVNNARDIRDLSLVRSEAELLLLPGAQLKTASKSSPDDYKLQPGDPDRVKGNPTATEWYRFEMTQTK